MNAFYVPALAGMIYAMPGMESQLHAVMNVPGDYEGFSSNYSGAGFSGMRFRFHGLDAGRLRRLGRQGPRRAASRVLDRAPLPRARRAERERARRSSFGDVDPDLFRRIVNRCVEEGRLCIDQMMALDARGGTGLAGALNTMPGRRAGRRASSAARRSTSPSSAPPPSWSPSTAQDTVVLLAPPPAPAAAPTDETL